MALLIALSLPTCCRSASTRRRLIDSVVSQRRHALPSKPYSFHDTPLFELERVVDGEHRIGRPARVELVGLLARAFANFESTQFARLVTHRTVEMNGRLSLPRKSYTKLSAVKFSRMMVVARSTSSSDLDVPTSALILKRSGTRGRASSGHD